MKDFTAGSKPAKGSGRERKKNKVRPSVYSSKHVRQQQAKADKSNTKAPQDKKKKGKNKKHRHK